MKKRLFFAVPLAVLLCQTALAAKTTYIATNHRFNYVKLKEVKPSVVEARGMTHPIDVSEDAVRRALAAIKLDKSYLVKREVASLEVFNEGAVNFLAPNFVKAFKQANAMEEVVFSYLCKDPIFILRNDHLNIGRAWMRGNELHIEFEKVHARLSGDYDKQGEEIRTISKARGVRVKLDYGPGQMPGATSDEVILDLGANFASEAPPAKEAASSTAAAPAPAPADVSADDARARLEKLKELKKEGLINSKEYEEKRKEILKEL